MLEQIKIKLKMLSMTQILMGVNIAVFLVIQFIIIVFDNSAYSRVILFASSSVNASFEGGIGGMILSAFVHTNLLHLGFNMYALWILGRYVENFFGAKKMFVVYILSAIVGSLGSAAFDIFIAFATNNTDLLMIPSVGASGAIFGLLGVLIGNKFRNSPYVPTIIDDAVLRQLLMVVAINFFFALAVNTSSSGVSIDNEAHIAGLIGGVIIGFILDPIHTTYQSKAKKLFENTLFWVSSGILVLGLFWQVLWALLIGLYI